MPETPETRLSLLVRVQDPRDTDAWGEFLDIYEPMIYRVARRRGLQDADARDVTQEVLTAVANALSDWNPEGPGTFRGWLYRIARNRAVNVLVRQSRHPRATGDSHIRHVLEGQSDDDADELIEEEYRRQLFRQAAGVIRSEFTESTWLAFWKTAVDGRPVQAIAAEMEMSVGAVYTARSRVLARLKTAVEENVEQAEAGTAGAEAEAN